MNARMNSGLTLPLKSLLPLASVWSKTTLNTGGVRQGGLHWGARGGGRPPRIWPCMKQTSRKSACRKYKKLPYVGFAPPLLQ